MFVPFCRWRDVSTYRQAVVARDIRTFNDDLKVACLNQESLPFCSERQDRRDKPAQNVNVQGGMTRVDVEGHVFCALHLDPTTAAMSGRQGGSASREAGY